MIVCLCYGVSDSRIASLHEAGHKTPECVARACGAGSACGGCVETIAELLQTPPQASAHRVGGQVVAEAR